MNIVILSGRLTREPNVTYSQGNEPIAVGRFTLAVNRIDNNVDFISCVAFKKQAEFLQKYCHKGTKILVRGRWQTGDYTNREGTKIYTNECIIENIEFAESKGKDESGVENQEDEKKNMNDTEDQDNEKSSNKKNGDKK